MKVYNLYDGEEYVGEFTIKELSAYLEMSCDSGVFWKNVKEGKCIKEEYIIKEKMENGKHVHRCNYCGKRFLSDRTDVKGCGCHNRGRQSENQERTVKKKCQMSLSQIAKIARDNGMSYGKFVAERMN